MISRVLMVNRVYISYELSEVHVYIITKLCTC